MRVSERVRRSTAVTRPHGHATVDQERRGLDDGAVALWIFVIAAAIGFVALPHIDIQGAYPTSDGYWYRLLAQHPHTFHISPFSNRVLTPWMVAVVPLRVQLGFATLTILSVAGTAAIVYLYARTFVERSAALRAVAFFAVAGGVFWLLLDPYLVDGPTMLLSILTFLLVRRGHLGWATVTMCAAVANHEYALFVLVTLVVAYIVENRKLTARLVFFVVLPVLVFVVIHNTPLIFGRVPPPYLEHGWTLTQWKQFLNEGAGQVGGLPYAVLFAVACSFGGVWVLALLGLRSAPRFLRATAVMLPLVFLVHLGSPDHVRYLTLAFPVVVVLACRVRIRWAVLIALLAVQATVGGLTLGRISATYSNRFGHRYATATLLLFSLAVVLIVGDRLLHPRVVPSATPYDGDQAGERRQIDATRTDHVGASRQSWAFPLQRVFILHGLLIAAVAAAIAVMGLAVFSISDLKTGEPVWAKTNRRNLPRGPMVGEVKTVDQASITITRPKGKDLKVYTTSATVIDKATRGTPDDITQGSTILVHGKLSWAGFNATTGEVLVLPPGSRFGSTGEYVGEVKTVDPNSVMITRRDGTDLRVHTTGTTVIDKAMPGTPEDITQGSTILVHGRSNSAGINATQGEILVLPGDSRFGATKTR